MLSSTRRFGSCVAPTFRWAFFRRDKCPPEGGGYKASTAANNARNFAGSLRPGRASTPLATSTAYGSATRMASAIFSGVKPPARMIRPYRRASRANFQSSVRPVPPCRPRANPSSSIASAAAIAGQRSGAKSPLHLNGLDHAMFSDQLVHFRGRFRSVKLHRAEPQSPRQRIHHQRRPIHEHADGFDKRRQAPNDAPRIRGTDGPRAGRIKIESERGSPQVNRQARVVPGGDPANFNTSRHKILVAQTSVCGFPLLHQDCTRKP